MVIEFIKSHPVGIAKGSIKEVDLIHGTRLISQGFAKESTQSKLDKVKQDVKAAEESIKKEVQENLLKSIAKVESKEDCCDDKEEHEEECEDCRKRAAAQAKKKTTKRTPRKRKAATKTN
jgi:hypothetical protein